MFLVDYVKAAFGKDLNPDSWDCAEDVCRLQRFKLYAKECARAENKSELSFLLHPTDKPAKGDPQCLRYPSHIHQRDITPPALHIPDVSAVYSRQFCQLLL